MSLDGLRAWIGVVERKLTMRTRVFLVLVAIAVGGAGAGIYLAIDANESAVSEADLQAVRDELDEQIAAGGGESELGQLEAEVGELKAALEALGTGAGAGGSGASEQPRPVGPAGGESSDGAQQAGTPQAKDEATK
jgi:hypothetical protein